MSENQAVVEPQDEIQDLNQEVQNEPTQVESNNTDDNESTETTETNTEQNQETPTEEQVQAVKKNKSIDNRIAKINKATWENRESERQAQAKIEELKQLQAQNAPKEPNIDDYESDADFKKDTKAYYENIANQNAQQIAQQKIQQQAHNQKVNKATAKWELARDAELEKNPEFANNVGRVAQTITAFSNNQEQGNYLASVISSDEQSVELFNYLAKNQEEAQNIAQLAPQGALMKLGAIKGKLSQPKKKKLTNAPEPVNPESGGSASTDIDFSFKNQADYNREMNKKQYGY